MISPRLKSPTRFRAEIYSQFHLSATFRDPAAQSPPVEIKRIKLSRFERNLAQSPLAA